MREAPLDDRVNSGSVHVFFTYGEYGFSSTGSQVQNCVGK